MLIKIASIASYFLGIGFGIPALIDIRSLWMGRGIACVIGLLNLKNQTAFVLSFLSVICNSNGQPTSGIFKMGLISYSYTDSSASQDRGVNYVLNEIKNSAESDLFFTADESMIVRNVKDAIKKVIYDNKNYITYTLMEKGKMKWYAVDSFPELMYSQPDTSAEYLAFVKSIKVSSLPEDQKNIFGFKCDKVTVHNPENPDQKVIFYRTNEISVVEIMDPMSAFIPGVSLETIYLFMPGITPTIGAISFTSKKFKKKHLGLISISTKRLLLLNWNWNYGI